MERQLWIDNLKGFCLFLIIIGHMGRIPALVGVIIRPTDLFYVTSFFFLSGWLFRDENYSFVDFLIRKAKSLLLPYLAISIAVSLLDWNLYLNTAQYLRDTFYSFLMGDGVPKASPLWFVSTLFFANVFLKLGSQLENKFIRLMYFLLLPFLCYVLYDQDTRLPMRVDSALGACFIMYVAQVTNRCLDARPFLRKYVFAISVVFVVYGYSANLGLLNYNTAHSWLSFPCAIGGSFFLAILFRSFLKRGISPFIWIAQNGLPVLGFHCLISFYVDILFRLIGQANPYVILMIKLTIVFATLYFVAMPLMRKFKPAWWGLR